MEATRKDKLLNTILVISFLVAMVKRNFEIFNSTLLIIMYLNIEKRPNLKITIDDKKEKENEL